MRLGQPNAVLSPTAQDNVLKDNVCRIFHHDRMVSRLAHVDRGRRIFGRRVQDPAVRPALRPDHQRLVRLFGQAPYLGNWYPLAPGPPPSHHRRQRFALAGSQQFAFDFVAVSGLKK